MSVEVTSVNMSLYLNILNIVFDSLSLLLCAVYVLLYCKSLKCNHRPYIVPKETFYAKIEKRYHPGETVDKILGFEIS